MPDYSKWKVKAVHDEQPQYTVTAIHDEAPEKTVNPEDHQYLMAAAKYLEKSPKLKSIVNSLAGPAQSFNQAVESTHIPAYAGGLLEDTINSASSVSNFLMPRQIQIPGTK